MHSRDDSRPAAPYGKRCAYCGATIWPGQDYWLTDSTGREAPPRDATCNSCRTRLGDFLTGTAKRVFAH